MKELILSIAVFAALIFTMPLVALTKRSTVHDPVEKNAIFLVSSAQGAAPQAAGDASEPAAASAQSGPDSSGQTKQTGDNRYFRVYDAKTGKIVPVEALAYVCGVVAGEMPSDFSSEALKAQAVAAFTDAVHHRENNLGGTGNASYHGADVSTDPKTCMAYLSQDDARKKWGASFEQRWAKIEAAVRAVAWQALTYEGKPIAAVFCSMSSGVTESSKDVWGTAKPYLIEVKSVGDTQSPRYETTVALTRQAVQKKIEKGLGVHSPGKHPAEWFRVVRRSGAGGVLEAKVCGKSCTGSELRKLFKLRSIQFTVSYQKGKFTFTVRGNGHGVGMSQYGANYMAKQGKTYDAILRWYYPGTTLSKYSWES